MSLCPSLLCPILGRVVTVQRWRGGEDQAGSGDVLQQPAFCSGDHQDQAKERLKVHLVHPGTDIMLTYCRKLLSNRDIGFVKIS